VYASIDGQEIFSILLVSRRTMPYYRKNIQMERNVLIVDLVTVVFSVIVVTASQHRKTEQCMLTPKSNNKQGSSNTKGYLASTIFETRPG
jgi:hypothetical protein